MRCLCFLRRKRLIDFGLSEEILEIIKRFFTKYPQVEVVKVFGSRAMGNYRPNSDIDFVLWGNIDIELLGKIAYELDELPTPYKFDVKIYDEIKHLKLKEHIDRVAKTFYQK